MMLRDFGYLEILRTNPGASIQDKGRIGLGKWGIPISGVMDSLSYDWINHLLKNNSQAAIIEISQPGFKCRFDSYTSIGLAGAKAEVKKNGKLISSSIIKIEANDELEIGKFLKGNILYLGVNQGFQTEEILGSRSFYPKITFSKMLSKGNKIPFFKNASDGKEASSSVKINTSWFDSEELEVYEGPDFKELPMASQKKLLESRFTLSNLANRMAFQLEELLANSISERITSPVYPGTVQLTSGGKLLILMRDAQVTGGYPRIFQLSEKSIAHLAQKKTGQKIRFCLSKTTDIKIR